MPTSGPRVLCQQLEPFERWGLALREQDYSHKYSFTQIPRLEYFTVNCVILFRYSVIDFQLLLQLQLLDIIQLQLQLTEAYFAGSSHFSYSYY